MHRRSEVLDLKKEQHGQLGMDLFASDGVRLQCMVFVTLLRVFSSYMNDDIELYIATICPAAVGQAEQCY
jgi:hypothetical protein